MKVLNVLVAGPDMMLCKVHWSGSETPGAFHANPEKFNTGELLCKVEIAAVVLLREKEPTRVAVAVLVSTAASAVSLTTTKAAAVEECTTNVPLFPAWVKPAM